MAYRSRILAIVVGVALLVGACGDSDESSPSGSTAANSTTSAAKPVTGGTVTFSSYSKISGLDPIVALGQGTSGGIPMAAIYDTLMRYDPATKQFMPRIAESATANADFTEWTVKIRSGVKFTDGTPYDAEAVKFGMNRHRSGNSIPVTAATCGEYFACPRNSTSSNAYMALVKDIAVVDSTTLKFTLNEPWTSFQYALASEASMIPSPTAIRKACTEPAKAANTCSYNLAPVGAGPFMVSSYKPDDVINMVRNPTYWNAPVYLDGINFLDGGDTGGPAVLEKITTGTAQAGFLRDPLAVDEARKAKIPGIVTPSYNGWIILINGGASVNCVGGAPAPLCVGKPDGPTPSNPVTKDIKVRQAIAAAIDPKVVNDRAFGGTAHAGSELFQSTFPWDPKVPGPKYDPETAKKLVAEAKAAGWNGNVRLACTSSQSGNNTALAVQTLLQAVGMTVNVSMGVGTATQLAVTTTKDYDLACWGLAIGPDHSALWSLAQNLASNSSSNRVGFNSPIVDQALRDLRVAKTDGDRTAAFKKIAEEVVAKVPWATLNSNEEYNAYSSKLHGLVGSNRSIVFFDKAWLE